MTIAVRLKCLWVRKVGHYFLCFLVQMEMSFLFNKTHLIHIFIHLFKTHLLIFLKSICRKKNPQGLHQSEIMKLDISIFNYRAVSSKVKFVS